MRTKGKRWRCEIPTAGENRVSTMHRTLRPELSCTIVFTSMHVQAPMYSRGTCIEVSQTWFQVSLCSGRVARQCTTMRFANTL